MIIERTSSLTKEKHKEDIDVNLSNVICWFFSCEPVEKHFPQLNEYQSAFLGGITSDEICKLIEDQENAY